MDRFPHTEAGYTDYVHWLEQQLDALRRGAFDELDVCNLILDLELTVQAKKHEVFSRLRVIILHLLRCEYQPQRKTPSWLRSLSIQRRELGYLLEESPGLRHLLSDFCVISYRRALNDAAGEARQATGVFPAQNPYTVEQLLDDDFLP